MTCQYSLDTYGMGRSRRQRSHRQRCRILFSLNKQAQRPRISKPEEVKLPSKSFLLEYCYENWAKWTECAKEEALRLHKEMWNSKANQRSDQLDTLLNVELLAARLSQVYYQSSFF